MQKEVTIDIAQEIAKKMKGQVITLHSSCFEREGELFKIKIAVKTADGTTLHSYYEGQKDCFAIETSVRGVEGSAVDGRVTDIIPSPQGLLFRWQDEFGTPRVDRIIFGAGKGCSIRQNFLTEFSSVKAAA